MQNRPNYKSTSRWIFDTCYIIFMKYDYSIHPRLVLNLKAKAKNKGIVNQITKAIKFKNNKLVNVPKLAVKLSGKKYKTVEKLKPVIAIL